MNKRNFARDDVTEKGFIIVRMMCNGFELLCIREIKRGKWYLCEL